MAQAKLDTTALWVNLDSIQISATRINKEWTRVSRSITEIYKDRSETDLRLPLNEYLKEVPGMFNMNASNFAQDARLSIRGFGSRSSFGVRGVKLLIDGIPETTPDGQGQLDAIPLSIIRSIEVIRGPAASLYGNASGGVVSMSTFSETNFNAANEENLVGRLLYGSFGTFQAQTSYLNKFGSTFVLGNASYSTSDGFRQNSGFQQTNLSLRASHQFSKYSKLSVLVDYMNSPQADDPGGLNLTQVSMDRRAAAPGNVTFGSTESVDQLRTGLSYSYKVNDTNTFDTYTFYSKRGFRGVLPFSPSGVIELERNYVGQGSSYTVVRKQNGTTQTLKYGYDVASQLDNRDRFNNDTIFDAEIKVLNQAETFKTVGVYVLGDFNLGSLALSGGLRFDHHAIKIRDDFPPLDLRSGEVNLSVLNPSFGLNYELHSDLSLYASFSRGFETPTLNEYGNNPVGGSGFNFLLQPQTSTNIDLGLNASPHPDLQIKVNLFRTLTEAEILPFEVDSLPGQRFFGNTGSTSRLGLETHLRYEPSSRWSAVMSYTFMNVMFDDYVQEGIDFGGNFLPGIPAHQGFLSMSYDFDFGLKLRSDNHYVGMLYASNDNSVPIAAYVTSDLHLSYSWKGSRFGLEPFFVVKNILGTEYFDNVRINAFGNRFYEPAAGLNFYGGISFRI